MNNQIMRMMHQSQMGAYTDLAARVLLALLFIVAGLNVIFTNFGGTVEYYNSLGIPVAVGALLVVLFVKIVGGLMVATGIHAREGAWALIAFVLIATLVAHTGEGQLINALKNLAIIGGLLLVATGHAHRMSWADKCPCPKCKTAGGGAKRVDSGARDENSNVQM